MDTDPLRPDDLSELERRLSGWRPASAGLDADAMLFAAGQAAARRGPARLVWPALTLSLVALATALGAWGASERSERLALAEQLRRPATEPADPSPPAVPWTGPTADELPPDSLLAARRALEQGLDAWPPRRLVPTRPALPEAPVLEMGQRNVLVDP
jgi:hypothetical protein